MLVAIHRDQHHCLATFRLNDDFGKVYLKPGKIYWLRIYTEEQEHTTALLRPLERNDVVVLKRSSYPEESAYEPKPPQKNKGLLLRVQFQVDNDLPFPKIIRWAFSSGSEDDYQTYRIPIHVKARLRTQAFLPISLVGVMLLSDIFGILVSEIAGSVSTPTLWTRIQASCLVSFFFIIVAWVFVKIMGILFTPKD